MVKNKFNIEILRGRKFEIIIYNKNNLVTAKASHDKGDYIVTNTIKKGKINTL